VFYYLSHTVISFYFTYFSNRVLLLPFPLLPARLDLDSSVYPSHVAGMTGMIHNTQLLLVEI
jgi:hypothetical protein